jgi:hypothetical protein
MPTCGFCGAEGQSKEHLWAGWLARAILESRAQSGMKTFEQQVERAGRVSSFPKKDLEHTVRMPCEPCNNGWMSDLENEVKLFLTDMAFRGQKTLLDEARQLSLVRWVVKTAMVNEFTGAVAEHKYFTESERRAFRERFAMPANLWIWLARYDGVLPLHSLQIRAPKGTHTPPTLYSLTFGSNFFVVQVFACREDRFGRIAEATQGPRLQQLYPSPGSWISWPPERTIDDDELQVLDYRFARVIGGTIQ